MQSSKSYIILIVKWVWKKAVVNNLYFIGHNIIYRTFVYIYGQLILSKMCFQLNVNRCLTFN